jgi:hypothetical protein
LSASTGDPKMARHKQARKAGNMHRCMKPSCERPNIII